jgi:Fe-S-cluster-containing dehydrogenase component/formate-dependent nitrite reductase membrane component NrfD
MQYGFLIDHRRCIGCHACTVACKAENDVPVGSFRTWVQYAEKGKFPAIRRHFAVLRCNHCTSAPCVTICPVNALEKRKDGIVDLDRDACIGCRACMQGCPYDAIYLNEDTGAAEKCHYCAHRVERGLEPACVIVCPESAIVSGDLHDPKSRIAGMVKEHATLVRRPEQRTGPNVHYLGVEPSMLAPGSASRPPTYLWSERPDDKPDPWPAEIPTLPDVRTVLDAGHHVEWGWHVAAYLVTKGIAAGAAMIAPFVAVFGLVGFAGDWLPEIVALAFTMITTYLLVVDLARPKLFLTLLTRPNPRSWLVRGAWILIAFSMSVPAEIAARLLGKLDVAETLRWLNAGLGISVAGYTAFLFAQCEGRDLWQSRRVLPHLLVQALLCGFAILAPFAVVRTQPRPIVIATVGALLLHAALANLERRGVHKTANARQAAAFMGTVRMGWITKPFRTATGPGTFLPVALLAVSSLHRFDAAGPVLLSLAALAAIGALYVYEWTFVRAGQLPPLS